MRKKRLGTIIQYLLIVILVFVLYNIFLIFGADKSNEKATSFFGYRLFVITSDSMEPTFNANDMIFVKTTNDYEIGDIITYKIDNTEALKIKSNSPKDKVLPDGIFSFIGGFCFGLFFLKIAFPFFIL